MEWWLSYLWLAWLVRVAGCVTAVRGALMTLAAIIAWPVSIVLRKNVELMHSPDPLKVRPGCEPHLVPPLTEVVPQAGMGARGAFMNSGSRDVGPDSERPPPRKD